jgi:hypothetical protein
MASDVKLAGDAVLVDGSLGIGTASPLRPLHVEGQEIHSGGAGAGFSFTDRQINGFGDNPGQRWVWYAEKGKARLWSGSDVISVGIGKPSLPLGLGTLSDSCLEIRDIACETAHVEIVKGNFPAGGRGLVIEASRVIINDGSNHGGELVQIASPDTLIFNHGAAFKTVEIQGDLHANFAHIAVIRGSNLGNGLQIEGDVVLSSVSPTQTLHEIIANLQKRVETLEATIKTMKPGP